MTGGDSMKVTVFTTMPPGIYSGGRYLSLMLAYAMARAGAEVTYVTNNAPLFERDFALFERLCPIRSVVTPDYKLPADLTSDWVVVIPTGGFNNRFYSAAIDHARAKGARLALLSFETPNWYAALSPYPRSPMPTESWRQVVEGGGLVVAIAREGVEPARAYFGQGPERAPRRFGFWHPAINDLAAAAAAATAGDRPRRSITMFVRTEDPHKGTQELLRLPPDVMDGHVLSLVFGRGVDEAYVAAVRRHFAPARDFAIEVLSQITDEEKFALLARSRLLLFPSWFEGYGYPPVEAAWMGVPTVAWDLPLLREVAGEAVTAVPPGDIEAFATAIRNTLATRPPGPEVRALMRVMPDTLTSGRAMLDLLRAQVPLLAPAAPVGPALPVAGGGGGLDTRAEQLLSHHAGGVHLFETRAQLRAGRVTFTGRIEGVRKGDMLHIALPHGSMPAIAPDPGGGSEAARRIACEGQLDRWPSGAPVLRLGLSLTRADKSRLTLGTVDLVPDWTALFAPSAEGGNRLPGDHVVLADPAQVAARPLLAALLCEFCATLSQAGHRAALVAPRPRSLPEPGLAQDLLPAFDCVVTQGSARMRGTVAEVRAAGGIVAATRGRAAAAGLDPAAALVLDPGGEAGDEVLLFLPAGAPAGRHALRPDARRWGRRGRAAAVAPLVVLVPDAPLAELDADTRRQMKHLEAALPGLRPVIPEALYTGTTPPLAGVNSRLEPVTQTALAALLAEGGPSVGLRLAASGADGRAAAPDAAALQTEGLLAAYRVPVAAATGAGTAAALTLLASEGADGGLAALLAGVLPAQAGAGTLAMPLGRIAAPPPPAPRRSEPPVVARGDVLGFSSTLDDEARGLAAGWSDRTILGARIARDHGVAVFRLGAAPAACTRLELMLHLSPAADPALSVKVLLNGHLLGTLSRLPVGASVHALPVREDAWSEDEQVLLLLLQRAEGANAASRITLVALSPGAASALPVRPPAATGHGTPRMAPLYAAPIGDRGGLAACRLAKGAAAGFLQLTAGWSVPEAEFTWSAGSLAVVGFHPPLAAEAPVLLTLRGSTLAIRREDGAAGGQRMILRHGAEVLAEAWLGPRGVTEVQVALPHLPGGAGVETLFLAFPDAVCPAENGMGDDRRLLGLALREAEAQVLTERLDQAPLRPDADAGWPVRLARLAGRSPGLLRLSGAGTMPPGLRFALAGGTAEFPALAVPGGWQASLPLAGTVSAGGRADVLCLSANLPAGDILAEIWAAPPHRHPDPAASSGELIVTLAAGPDQGLPGGRGVPTGTSAEAPPEMPVDGATPPEGRLTLPATFAFRAGSPALAHLGAGWSHPEADWVWNAGTRSTLVLPAPAGAGLIRVEASALVFEGLARQRMRLTASGTTFATVVFGTAATLTVAAVLPPGAAPWNALHLGLPDAVVPAEAGLMPDQRQLALRLQRLDVEALPGALWQGDPVAPGAEAAILREAVLADGSRAILVAGAREVPPFGLAAATLAEVVVIAHARPVPGGWQAHLVLAEGDVGPDGHAVLHVYGTEADADAGSPTDLLILPVPPADMTAGGMA